MTVRLMNDNYLDEDNVASASVSSEQSAFPVSNIYNFERRSKVWRSNGYWEIDGTNNVIIFQETVATPLTATVAVSNYTSSTTFSAAIKTALEAAGGSTYTVSVDSGTSKIKISSNGGGGGGIFQILWTNGSTTMADVLGFDDSSDSTGALTYTADLVRIHYPYEWIKWDMGITTLPKAFVLIGKRNEALKISTSATLTLQGNETDVWSSPSYEQELTYSDSVITVQDSDGLHTSGLRYWRLQIENRDNSQGYVEIGSLYLGDFLIQTRGRVQFPLENDFIDESPTVFSEGGQTYSDIREKTESFTFSWAGLTIAEKEEMDTFITNVGTSKPFFITFDPSNTFSNTDNYYLRYVKFQREPRYRLESPGNWSCQMQVREQL
jgi:hypothetical protein